jgi:glycosyltransferase involved in cell wall biosynthesis/phenylacetate-coenzyme A ligase PaaK-like adenylate-forming protein
MTAREALLGPSYRRHVRLIERSRTWTPAEIEAYQQARLQRLTHRYGDKITHKEDYRVDLDRFTRWNVPFLMQTIHTGGTSGEPLRFRMDTVVRRQKELAYMFDIWSTIGYSPFDLRVVYRGNVNGRLCHFEPLQNRWVISAGASMEDRLYLRQWARKLQPFFLHVYPSSLFVLIDLLGESLFRSLPIKGILAGSESFPVGQADRFEKDFGISVAHWYGHSEYAVLAYRCKICKGFHFFPTYGNVELLASNDNQLRRIVASSFNKIGTQFVRYDTGDLAEPPLRICVDNFPLVGDIVGRSQETFVDSTGLRRALGPFIFGIHGSFWDEIRDLQFVQERAGQMRVRLVADATADRGKIQKSLEQRLSMVRLEFDYVSRVEHLPNGKRSYYINNSERTAPELDAVSSSAHKHPIRVLLMADAQSPITQGWVDAVRSAGVTVLGTDGKEWSECRAAPGNDGALGARLNQRFRSFSKATPRRLIAVHALRRLVGPSLARLKGRQLRRLVEKMQPDLIHALRIPYEGVMAAAACPPNVPLAVSIWGNDLTLIASMNPLIARATRKVLERTDLLYADCQRDLDLAMAWGLRSNASKSLLPGGGGIDLQKFTKFPRPSESPDRDPKQSNLRIVVNARGIREYVRNDTLLRALSILAPDIDSHVRIIFVGVSRNKDLCAKISRHPLADKIIVTAEHSPTEMADLFHRAEVSVSITDHDGTPNSLLEAMAAGAVPVCGDIPSIHEWIQPGRNGFLADPSNPYEVASALRVALNLSAADREVIGRENKRIIVTRAERRATGREAAKKYRSLVDAQCNPHFE